MTLVAFVDANFGVTFLNKRQSKDSAADLFINEFFNGSSVWKAKSITDDALCGDVVCKPYDPDAVQQDDGYLDIFCTNIPWSKIDKVLLINWNRVYPSTSKFAFPADKSFVLKSFKNFSGSSHDVLTAMCYETKEEERRKVNRYVL